MGSKTFKSLQAKWYRKLEKAGFDDIEKDGHLRDWDGFHFKSNYSPEQFAEKKDYYEKAKDLLNRDVFIDGVERRIWALHTCGFSIRKIVNVLKCEGIKFRADPSEKDTVNKVINEFQKMIIK